MVAALNKNSDSNFEVSESVCQTAAPRVNVNENLCPALFGRMRQFSSQDEDARCPNAICALEAPAESRGRRNVQIGFLANLRVARHPPRSVCDMFWRFTSRRPVEAFSVS